MDLHAIMRKIKVEYGVNQTTLAGHIGVSPQILTDIKAGRRRFSPAMAESIMSLFAHKTDVGWLAEALQAILAGGTGDGVRERSNADAVAMANTAIAGARLPVLDMLCKAAPTDAAGKSVLIPETLAPFLDKAAFSYVLVLDYDDYAGRLRAGDRILIVQNGDIIREIMVVESKGRMRLARNASYLNGATQGNAKEQWLALDTGKPVTPASYVGAVVGIVSAVL